MKIKENIISRFLWKKTVTVSGNKSSNINAVKICILLLTILFTPSDAFSNYYIDKIAGTWKSQRGVIYKSDGSNFVCLYMPEQYMDQYGHWLNKNGLTGFRYTKDGLTVLQYFRIKGGQIYQVPTDVEVYENKIILRFKIPSKGKQFERVFTRI